MLVEVVACSVEDAIAATRAGADRIELCSSISVGGLTPSLGLEKELPEHVLTEFVAMVRCREGDFCYTNEELSAMEADASAFHEARGVVFGCLDAEGDVDIEACQRLRKGGRFVTIFHRAFDSVRDPFASLELVIGLGFRRVLTSGLAPTAVEGADLICELRQRAAGRIEIMAGGGIRPHNVQQVIRESGVDQIHLGPFVEGPHGALVLDEATVAETIRLAREV